MADPDLGVKPAHEMTLEELRSAVNELRRRRLEAKAKPKPKGRDRSAKASDREVIDLTKMSAEEILELIESEGATKDEAT